MELNRKKTKLVSMLLGYGILVNGLLLLGVYLFRENFDLNLTYLLIYQLVFLSIFICICTHFFKNAFSESQELRQELTRCEKELKTISQVPKNNPNPLLRLSLDGSILYTNPALEKKLS